MVMIMMIVMLVMVVIIMIMVILTVMTLQLLIFGWYALFIYMYMPCMYYIVKGWTGHMIFTVEEGFKRAC